MSDKDVGNEIAKAEDTVKVCVSNLEGKVVEMTVENLEDLAFSLGKVTEITVNAERNLNKGNFENEKFGQSTTINFRAFWTMIDDNAMRDPVNAKKIQKAFANGAMRAIGHAYRDIYVNHLYSIASRCRQLALPQQKIILAEMQAMNSTLTYDPFNVVEKETK